MEGYRGSGPTSPQFRRLNSCRNHRLIVFNIWGSDERGVFRPIVVLPSKDLALSQAQRELHARNLQVNKHKDRTVRVPFLSYQLNSGMWAAEYAVGAHGPLIYDGGNWVAQFLALLDGLTACQPAQHPPSTTRQPHEYRILLHDLHEKYIVDTLENAHHQSSDLAPSK